MEIKFKLSTEDFVESISQVKKCICFTQPDKLYGSSLALIVEKNNISDAKIINQIKDKLINLPNYYNPKRYYLKKFY